MPEESDPKQNQDPKPSSATQESRPSSTQPRLPEGEDGHWDRPDD
jgi:hypothetical protein